MVKNKKKCQIYRIWLYLLVIYSRLILLWDNPCNVMSRNGPGKFIFHTHPSGRGFLSARRYTVRLQINSRPLLPAAGWLMPITGKSISFFSALLPAFTGDGTPSPKRWNEMCHRSCTISKRNVFKWSFFSVIVALTWKWDTEVAGAKVMVIEGLLPSELDTVGIFSAKLKLCPGGRKISSAKI